MDCRVLPYNVCAILKGDLLLGLYKEDVVNKFLVGMAELGYDIREFRVEVILPGWTRSAIFPSEERFDAFLKLVEAYSSNLQDPFSGSKTDAYRFLPLKLGWTKQTPTPNYRTLELIVGFIGFDSPGMYSQATFYGAFEGFFHARLHVLKTILEMVNGDFEGVLAEIELNRPRKVRVVIPNNELGDQLEKYWRELIEPEENYRQLKEDMIKFLESKLSRGVECSAFAAYRVVIELFNAGVFDISDINDPLLRSLFEGKMKIIIKDDSDFEYVRKLKGLGLI